MLSEDLNINRYKELLLQPLLEKGATTALLPSSKKTWVFHFRLRLVETLLPR